MNKGAKLGGKGLGKRKNKLTEVSQVFHLDWRNDRCFVRRRDGRGDSWARILYQHVHNGGQEYRWDEFVVHHIDGDCTNDSIENLELLTRQEHYDLHWRDSNKGRAASDAAYLKNELSRSIAKHQGRYALV